MSVNITRGSSNSLGMDIMRRINEGSLKKTSTKDIEAVKAKIVENCGEIIEQGARVRPLMKDDGEQIGWSRGVHVAERQLLKHWIKEPNDYILNVLLLGTTFTKEELEAMSGYEIRSLTEVVQQMTTHDTSLIPYLPAYSTTYDSENLWFSHGEQLASWENREMVMPDGKKIHILRPSSHAKAWVSFCSYREQNKRRLEANFNSLFIVRPWAGKSADPIQAELNRIQKGLETNASEPWEQIVRPVNDVDVNDGWGHPGDSFEDLKRELDGMMKGDKHERLMEAWQKQMIAEDEARKKKLEEARKKRGTDRIGIIDEKMEVLTEKQIKDRQKALREGRPAQQPQVARRDEHEAEAIDRQLEKARRYR